MTKDAVKFKKGDRVRIKEFPEALGTITRVTKQMLWCKLDGYKGTLPFCKPENAELVTK